MFHMAWTTLRRGVTAVALVAGAVLVAAMSATTAAQFTCGALPLLTLPDRVVDCATMYTPALSLFVASVDVASCAPTPFALRLTCQPALMNVQGFPAVVAPTPGAAFSQRYTFTARLPSVIPATLAAIPCTVKVNNTSPEYGDASLVLHLANCTCAPPYAPVLAARPRADAQRGVVVSVRNVALPTCAAVQGVLAVNNTRVRVSSVASTLFSFTRGYNQTFAFAFNVSSDAGTAPIPATFVAALSSGAAALLADVTV
jgi:hypothetical protein